MNELKLSEQNTQENGIERVLVKKEILKTFIISHLIFPWIWLTTIWIMIAINADPTNPFPLPPLMLGFLNLILLVFTWFVPVVVMVGAGWAYYVYYVNTFSYELTPVHIVIKHGVFTKHKSTIPYSRIQNINVVNGVFDRIYKIFTIKIETAGGTMASGSGGGAGRSEGYIPGLKAPTEFEAQLKQMIDKYSVLPSGLEAKIFKPHELAFDNFVSYVLTKIRDKNDLLQSNIKSLREKQNISVHALAEKIGVKPETIELLEAGRYTPSLSLAYKIARELETKIENLFVLD